MTKKRAMTVQEMGQRGGHARAKALTAERRQEIARGAAVSRWTAYRRKAKKDAA